MKKLFLSLAAGLLFTGAMAQTKWSVDASHSNVKFSVTHMVVSEVEGSFRGFEGNVTAPTADFNNATIDFSVKTATVFTDNDQRDAHLKGDDFFNAEKFPTMSFKSTSFKKVSGNKYTLTGNLTIRDVTKPVTFEVTYGGTAKDPWGNTKAGFKAKGSIKRLEYGLKWNTLTEAGGMVVGDEVGILLNIELLQGK